MADDFKINGVWIDESRTTPGYYYLQWVPGIVGSHARSRDEAIAIAEGRADRWLFTPRYTVIRTEMKPTER